MKMRSKDELNELRTVVRERRRNDLLTVDEVAEILECSKNKAYLLFKSKGFPSVKSGKNLIVAKDDLVEYLNDNKLRF